MDFLKPEDNRKVECLATDLPLYNGAQVAVDAALVSPLRADGLPRPRAEDRNGVTLREIKRDKERRYHELHRTERCKLVVAAMEVGGRWAEDAYDFLDQLAQTKAREASRALRKSAQLHWVRRWSTLVSFAAHRAFADTLLHGTAAGTDYWEGRAPTLGELLGNEPHSEAPLVSGMPLKA